MSGPRSFDAERVLGPMRKRLRRLLRHLEEGIVPGQWDARLSAEIDRVTAAIDALGPAPERPAQGQGRAA